MAAKFTNPDTVARNPLGYAGYPVQASLKDRFVLGGDEESTVTNQVADRANATIAGDDIDYGAGFVTFGGDVTTNLMTMATNDNEFTNVTRIAIVRHLGAIASANDWRQAFGCFNSSVNGLALFSNVATMANGTLPEPAAIGIEEPPHDAFHYIAMTYDNAAKRVATFYGRRGKIYAGGLSENGSAVLRAAAPLMIGGQWLLGSTAAALDIAVIDQHNAVLTLDQFRESYLYDRDRLGRLPTPVTVA